MPTYDYVCRFCEHAFDLFQGISEPLKRKCPECGRMGLDRLIGAGIGIVFKGSGFYETDYKRSSGSNEAASEKKSDKSTGPTDKVSNDSSAKKDGGNTKPSGKGTAKPKDG